MARLFVAAVAALVRVCFALPDPESLIILDVAGADQLPSEAGGGWGGKKDDDHPSSKLLGRSPLRFANISRLPRGKADPYCLLRTWDCSPFPWPQG